MPTRSTIRIRPITVALIVLGVAFVALGAVYFVTRATDLPSFFPGHQAGLTKHHAKHGLAMLGLAVICWIVAWFTTAPGKPAAADS